MGLWRWLGLHGEKPLCYVPKTISCLAEEQQTKNHHVRRDCVLIFKQGRYMAD